MNHLQLPIPEYRRKGSFFIFSLYVNQSWITATIFDLCYSLFNQLVTIVLLLVFLPVHTERNDDSLKAINQAD